MPDKKWYTTGQVAQICQYHGERGVRLVARLFDADILRGIIYRQQHWRKSIRLIPSDSLMAYMENQSISLDRLDAVEAQEWPGASRIEAKHKPQKKALSCGAWSLLVKFVASPDKSGGKRKKKKAS